MRCIDCKKYEENVRLLKRYRHFIFRICKAENRVNRSNRRNNLAATTAATGAANNTTKENDVEVRRQQRRRQQTN